MLMNLLKIAAITAVALAVLIWPTSWLLAGQAKTVQLIAPFDEAVVDVNRFEYEDEPSGEDADVIAIYGTPFGEPEAVLFVDAEKIMHPIEKPALALLPKAADENPFKVDSLSFLARFISLGAAVAALGSFLLFAYLRRRRGAVRGARTD